MHFCGGKIPFKQTRTRQAARLLDITDISVEEITPTYHKVGKSNHFTRKCQSFHPTTDSELEKKKSDRKRSARCRSLCDSAMQLKDVKSETVTWQDSSFAEISSRNPSRSVLKGSFSKSFSENDYTDRHLLRRKRPELLARVCL